MSPARMESFFISFSTPTMRRRLSAREMAMCIRFSYRSDTSRMSVTITAGRSRPLNRRKVSQMMFSPALESVARTIGYPPISLLWVMPSFEPLPRRDSTAISLRLRPPLRNRLISFPIYLRSFPSELVTIRITSFFSPFRRILRSGSHCPV